jgi:hypothetical protein
MSLDDLVLLLQRLVDRLVRRVRLGRAPRPGRRRLLIVQIDGLSRAILERGLAEGRMPFTRSLLRARGYRLVPMSVGMPTSTPAFQMAAMYGVRPDIPGFHYHDKRRRRDVYFPRGGDAAFVEESQAQGRVGILREGSSYGCVFTGGATNNLFSFAMIKRPTGAGLLPVVSAFVVLGWVMVKCLALSSIEIARAVLRFVANPPGESALGWKLFAIKVGLSVWLRELFTLAVARDLYGGVPAVYVNYLDYDVFAHEVGPGHRRALLALRRVDRSVHQLWRVCRRVPEHRYDLYILADHGQAACQPFSEVAGGRRIERVLLEDVFDPSATRAIAPGRPDGRRRLASGIKAIRRGRAPGMFQRFVNYLEHDFPWLLGEEREAREHQGIRIVAAGPNTFVYFLDDASPLPLETIDARFPGAVDEISQTSGIGYVLVRSAAGPVCVWRGKRYRLEEGQAGPFANRGDLPLVVQGVRDLMAMPSAGDLVLYGLDAPEGNVSFIAERGAHAGPSAEELHTFVIAPPGVELPTPITHPVQLYPHFSGYQEAA